MDRYSIRQHRNARHWNLDVANDPNGEWVKYSDVEALQARVRELEGEVEQLSSEVGNARETMHGEIRYNTELRNRVRELEEALLEISRNQIPCGTYTPDAGEDIQIVHMRMSAWQLLHGIGYELNTKGTP